MKIFDAYVFYVIRLVFTAKYLKYDQSLYYNFNHSIVHLYNDYKIQNIYDHWVFPFKNRATYAVLDRT